MQNDCSCDVCSLHRPQYMQIKAVFSDLSEFEILVKKRTWCCDRFEESDLIFRIIMMWLYVVLHSI